MVKSWWLSLQHDWVDGFANQEKVWVSAHHIDAKTCHSFLTADGPTDTQFASNLISEKNLKVTHLESGASTEFVAPHSTHKITPRNNPVAADITDSGGLGAVSDGADILIFECLTGIVRRKLSGHLFDVECLKFFPSNLVLLSGGGDMCLKIWSVEDGSCPVTLTGHKRAITSLDIVGRGKQILSSSLDGTVKLWTCSTGECSATLSLEAGSVNDISILNESSVASVTSNGSLFLHCLSNPGTAALHFTHSSELTACAVLSDAHVLAGSVEGELVTIDLRNTGKALHIQQRSACSISTLCKDQTTAKVWCAQKDGECYSIRSPLDPQLHCDLTLSGGDCEAILQVAAKDNHILTTAKDRIVRRYEL